MRTPVSIAGIGVVIGVTIQMGFLLNSEVLYGSYLTALGILLGLVVGVAIYLYKKHRNAQSMYVMLDYSGKLPWYKGVFHTELILSLCIVFTMVAVSLLNNVPNVFATYEQGFVVSKKGERRIRYDQFQYIELTDNDVVVKHLTENKNFTIGQQVTVKMRKGLLGFPLVVEVLPSNG
ncbi:hypothetical protein [Microbulbifer sp. PSTR4-B]|uniref:hypothetical protein n=1 Tax=unclassified Microbulbifer TaxID=2619833 RepID=UPI0040394E74